MSSVTSIPTSDFDGIYFTTIEDGEKHEYQFFKLDSKYKENPVEPTEIGHRWHIALFKDKEDGTFRFDDHFEAVFENPVHYVKNMLSMGLEGCVLRKTENSKEWFDHYLSVMKEHVIIDTVIPTLEAIKEKKREE